MRSAALAVVMGAALLGGCATSAGMGTRPIEVTRFHLGTPLERGTVAVEPAGSQDSPGPEFQGYADAVHGELGRAGYPDPAAGERSQYIALVGVSRVPRGMVERRPPVSIGIGGGTSSGGYGGGVGIGGGVSFPIGRRRLREVVQSELSVQIKRRTDATVIWEGRAQTTAIDDPNPGAPAIAAGRLASALFRGFPGESGITITAP